MEWKPLLFFNLPKLNLGCGKPFNLTKPKAVCKTSRNQILVKRSLTRIWLELLLEKEAKKTSGVINQI